MFTWHTKNDGFEDPKVPPPMKHYVYMATLTGFRLQTAVFDLLQVTSHRWMDPWHLLQMPGFLAL